MENQILALIMYCLPAVVTGVIAYLFFKGYTHNENKRRDFILNEFAQKEGFLTRLQAYERLTLFLERISAHHLLKRVSPISKRPIDYKDLLIANVEQEFEHNQSQQIYVSFPCWKMLVAAKNGVLQTVIEIDEKKYKSADDLRPILLNKLTECKVTPEMALSFLKKEVSRYLK